ncbi:MAG TPA: hypothetical protein VLT62_27490 [Candidatus Methylomirabilis sp.]|nr:hypothetical protein [Candidatus Methylomirabilis sp.]
MWTAATIQPPAIGVVRQDPACPPWQYAPPRTVFPLAVPAPSLSRHYSPRTEHRSRRWVKRIDIYGVGLTLVTILRVGTPQRDESGNVLHDAAVFT